MIGGGSTEANIVVFCMSKKIGEDKIRSYLTEEGITVESLKQASFH